MPHQIVSDGTTVWVNDATGYCLGRFGRMGIDVHVPPSDDGGRECLYCMSTYAVTIDDWQSFVSKMREHHGVKISHEYMPKNFSHEQF